MLERRIYRSMPVFQIWKVGGAAPTFILNFSEQDNQPIVTVEAEEYQLAPPTMTEGGTIFTHDAGLRWNWRIEYQCWPEESCKEYRNAPEIAPQFTEYEYGLLEWGRWQPTIGTTATHILFYPHRDMATGSDTERYRVFVTKNILSRTGLAQDRGIAGVIECTSQYPIANSGYIDFI